MELDEVIRCVTAMKTWLLVLDKRDRRAKALEKVIEAAEKMKAESEMQN